MTAEQTYRLNLDVRLDDEQCKATIDTPRHGACMEIVVRYAGAEQDDDILVARARDIVHKLNTYDALLAAAHDLTWYRDSSNAYKEAEALVDKLMGEHYNDAY